MTGLVPLLAVSVAALAVPGPAAAAQSDGGATAGTSPVGDAMAAVVQVQVQMGDATGTGWLAAPGRVVTAAHVVGAAATVTVLSGDRTTSGTVVGVAPDRDLALVDIAPAWLDAPPLRLRVDAIDPGADVYAIGHALGDPVVSVTRGIVGSVRDDAGTPMIQTDAAVNSGVSGGPLVDDGGRVAGVLVSKAAAGEGIGHAVAAPAVAAFVAAPPAPPAAAGGAPGIPLFVWPVGVVAVGCALAVLQLRRRPADDEVAITLGAVRVIDSQEQRP